MLLSLVAIVTGAGALIVGGAMLGGSEPADPIMLAVLVIAGICSAICGYLALSGGSPVEMPGGETVFPPPEPSPPRKRWRLTIERR